jgi:broad specificity phosphatase PhoE
MLRVMPRIWLVRHGETEWNALGRLQGLTDIPLNETGRQQAAAVAARFAATPLAALWSSDLGRARETAAIIAAARGATAPGVDDELRERCFGVFEGLTRDQCAEHHPEAWQAWQASAASPPGGEELELVAPRMQRALERIFASLEASGDEGGAGDAASAPGDALVVSHGGAMRLWLRTVISAPIPLIRNGAAYLVERSGDGFTAQLIEEEGVVHAPGPQDSIVPAR